MDNSYCCVPQCNSRGSNLPRTSFHRFPNAKDLSSASARLREEWIRVLKIGKKVSKRMVVCGKHFQPSDFFPRGNGPLFRTKLKKNVVPSLNIPLSSCENIDELNKKKENNLIRLERREKRDRSKEEIFENLTNMNSAGRPNTSKSFMMINCGDEDDDGEIGTNSEATALNNEDEILAAEGLMSLSDKMQKDVGTQVTTGDLIVYHSFLRKMSEPGLNSLTGIHSMALLETLVKLLQNNSGKLFRSHQMPLKHQVVLTFMRLKLDLPFASLSALFECTATTCKSIFSDVLQHLAVHLKCAIPWLSKEQVLERMPSCFTPSYRNTRVILDCTEISVQKTDCSKCQIMTYSQYKAKSTIKLMCGVAPSGVLTFISQVYGGRASDKEIFKQSNVIQFVEPHQDAIMVDRGFLIDDICIENFIELFRPPFLKQSRYSGSDSTKNTSIARARVHVERMIQRIKIFKIFQGTIPWNMLPHINDMIIVCSGIANLGKPILADDKF